MKIKVSNYMGLFLMELAKKNPTLYRKSFADELLRIHMEDPDYINTFNKDQLDLRKKVMYDLLYNTDYKTYIVTQAAGEKEIMKIKDPIKVIPLLDKIPVKRGMFIMNKKEYFKYYFDNDDLYMVWIMVGDNFMVTYSAFHIVISTGYIGGDTNEGLRWTVENFLRTLIYTFYSKNDFVFVKPNEKKGKTYNEKVWNESPFDITIVDSFWNKTIYHLDEFDVNGHFRFQACGRNWQDRELIWISSFKKQHYIRKSKKNPGT